MKKLMIEDVKVGISEGGMACGPVSGHVVAEVCIRDLADNTVAYHLLAEVEGTLNFFLTKESTFDGQIEEDYENTAFWDLVSAGENGGYTDYGEFYEDLDAHEICDEDDALVWKYLAYMVRADWDEIDQMKKLSIGKCLGEFEIPVCDAEADYLEECESEDDEDFTPPASQEVYALQTLKEGCYNMQPCPCKDVIVAGADEMWNSMSQVERNSYETFRVVRAMQHWSEVIGPVYGEPTEIVKDYKN